MAPVFIDLTFHFHLAMEGAGGVVEEGMRSVIIRTPDQRVKDMEVTCQPKWTVANLKQHLSLLYPGNPV